MLCGIFVIWLCENHPRCFQHWYWLCREHYRLKWQLLSTVEHVAMNLTWGCGRRGANFGCPERKSCRLALTSFRRGQIILDGSVPVRWTFSRVHIWIFFDLPILSWDAQRALSEINITLEYWRCFSVDFSALTIADVQICSYVIKQRNMNALLYQVYFGWLLTRNKKIKHPLRDLLELGLRSLQVNFWQ